MKNWKRLLFSIIIIIGIWLGYCSKSENVDKGKDKVRKKTHPTPKEEERV